MCNRYGQTADSVRDAVSLLLNDDTYREAAAGTRTSSTRCPSHARPSRRSNNSSDRTDAFRQE